ncbi:hypothetical protein, partial [Corallococcus terminator]
MPQPLPHTNFQAARAHDSLAETVPTFFLLTQLLVGSTAASASALRVSPGLIVADLQCIAAQALAASNVASATAAPPTLHAEVFAPTALACEGFCQALRADGLTV